MVTASSFLDFVDGKPQIRRFTRKEYHALIDAGVLTEDEKVELIDGVVLTMSPQGPDHSRTVGRLNKHLLPPLLDRAEILVHSPFAASEDDEPEPDLLIFALDTDESDHPTRAHCAIEVSVTSQARDRSKVNTYARAAVPQLILIDVPKREARVFRGLRSGEYGLIEIVREGTPIVIDAFPDVSFDLASVLPKATT